MQEYRVKLGLENGPVVIMNPAEVHKMSKILDPFYSSLLILSSRFHRLGKQRI